MKIKAEERSVTLVPESEWEHDQLRRLKYSPIKTKQFEHEWEGAWGAQGGLVLDFGEEDWGR